MKLFLILCLSILILIPSSSNAVIAQSNTDIYAIAWSPSGNMIALGHFDGTIYIRDAQSGNLMHTLSGNTSPVLGISWNSDGTRLAAGYWDGTVLVWNPINEQLITTYTEHSEAVSALIWYENDASILSAVYGFDDSIIARVWNASSGITSQTPSLPAPVAEFRWGPDGSLLAFADGGGGSSAVILDAATLTVVKTLVPSSTPVLTYALDWNSTGNRIAVGRLDGSVLIWDVDNEQLLFTLQGNDVSSTDPRETSIISLAFSPDDMTLTSISGDGTLRTWDTSTGQIIDTTQLDGPIYAAEWSPDGSQIAYGGSSGTYTIIPAPEAIPAPN